MLEIVSKLVAAKDVVVSFEVLELIDEETVKLIKVKALLHDRTLLYLTELHTPRFQKYSYHLQGQDGALIARWDNSPHWPELSTFPHHKHEAGEVFLSERGNITLVIDFMRKRREVV